MFRLIFVIFVLMSTINARHHSLDDLQISGGKHAFIKAFPYQAGIEYNGEHICGASIIGEDSLLTAAHCVNDDPNVYKYKIRVGSTYHGEGGQVFQPRGFKIHNAHSLLNSDFLKYSFDIAVIFIRGRFTYDRTISPIALPTSKKDCPMKNVEGVISGWGRTEKGIKPKELRYTRVPIWELDKCRNILGRVKVGTEMFCAGGFKDISGTCRGDSGGPLVINGKLCGIVSWGKDCSDIRMPEVYTKVTFFLEWIQVVLGPNRH